MELLGRYSKIHKPLTKRLADASGRPRRLRPLVHSARRRLDADERTQLAADYKAGRSTTWLTKTYHLGKGTVLNVLAEQGVKMRGQGIPHGRLEEAITLYKSGLSLKAVGAHFGCNAETVRQTLLAAGVQMRTRWERGSR